MLGIVRNKTTTRVTRHIAFPRVIYFPVDLLHVSSQLHVLLRKARLAFPVRVHSATAYRQESALLCTTLNTETRTRPLLHLTPPPRKTRRSHTAWQPNPSVVHGLGDGSRE